jgi:hypothetical protein
MSILKIKDENGNIIDIPALRGKKGDTGKNAYQYAQEGGYAGTEAEFAEDINPDNIKAEVMPVLGTDYFTELDKDEIAARVYALIRDGGVVGFVDEDNNIVLSGNLADGTYTLKYENEDGTYTEIGALEVDNIPNPTTYKNILTSGDYTVKLNTRWSSSGKAYKDSNGMICIFIPIADVNDKTIRFKGFPYGQQSADSTALWFTVDASNTQVSALLGLTEAGLPATPWNSKYLVDEGNGVYSIPINNTTFTNMTNAANLVINLAVGTSAITTLPDTLIMTIDEEIV